MFDPVRFQHYIKTMSKDKDSSQNNQPAINEVKGVQKAMPKVSYELRKPTPDMPEEMLGRDGPEPTRFGDWEIDGKCTDF